MAPTDLIGCAKLAHQSPRHDSNFSQHHAYSLSEELWISVRTNPADIILKYVPGLVNRSRVRTFTRYQASGLRARVKQYSILFVIAA